ncbi:MAG: glycosyltransferase [Candidatus Eremiobacteraeota bacterium]|nr:glycosyltransferase [Candidatus Eremiobacteraeota bacterium]
MISARIEGLNVAGTERTLIDVIAGSEAGYHAVPFLESFNDKIIVPRKALEFGDRLEEVVEQTHSWLQKTGSATAGFHTVHLRPQDAGNLRELQPYVKQIPGLASYQDLFAIVERYAHARRRVANRRVFDAHPGLGYGAGTLDGIGARIWAHVDERAQRELAALFAFVDFGSLENLSDAVCLALDCPAPEIPEVVQSCADASLIIVSSRGAEGAQALSQWSAERMGPLALPSIADAGESIAFIDNLPETHVPQHRNASEAVTASAIPLHILFALRPSADFVSGGDVAQVRRTAQALRDRGHEVTVSTHGEPDCTGFDVVNLTNITVPSETLAQARAVRKFEGPVVFMPIFLDHADETAWGIYTAMGCYINAHDDEQLRSLLSQLASRSISSNNVPPPPARPDMVANYQSEQREILSMVDHLIVNANSEVHRLYRFLDNSVPFSLAPSATDASVYHKDAAVRFIGKYGLKDFILTTGRIEPRKNQLALLYAMKRWPERRLVVIGQNFEFLYGLTFAMYWGPNVIVLPHMPEEELAGAYAAARVVCQPSWDEVVSLSVLNAAACEASLVVTRNGYEHEYLGDDAEYCDPADVESIADAIDRAWISHDRRGMRRAELARKVHTEYTWSRSAELTERAYYDLLAFNPRAQSRRA